MPIMRQNLLLKTAIVMWILLLPIKRSGCGQSPPRFWCSSRRDIRYDKIPAELKSFQEAVDSIKRSMAELDTEYIDLVLIHAPRPWKIMRDNPEQKIFRRKH